MPNGSIGVAQCDLSRVLSPPKRYPKQAFLTKKAAYHLYAPAISASSGNSLVTIYAPF